jgi:hypothetical protein
LFRAGFDMERAAGSATGFVRPSGAMMSVHDVELCGLVG